MDLDTQLPLSCPLWKRLVKRVVYPIMFKMPTMFLPAGTRQANYLKYYGVDSKRITVEQMTVDVLAIQKCIADYPVNAFTEMRLELGLQENDIVFLFVGRLVDWKGINELGQAFNKLINNNVKLVIVGDGPMRRQVEMLSTDPRIKYLGRKTSKELISLYFISDVVVLASYDEPWGLVVNEAMAAGKPVIVTDRVGCIDDLVVHEKTGLIVKAKSVTSLCDAMLTLIEDDELSKKMAENALETISNWSIENEAVNICTAWEAIL